MCMHIPLFLCSHFLISFPGTMTDNFDSKAERKGKRHC